MPAARVRILLYKTPGALRRHPPCQCCEVVDDPALWEEADAIVLHVPTLRRFPPGKRAGQVWVALSVESAVHYPVLAQRHVLGGLFDLWMTYRRDADVWCPYLDPGDAERLATTRAADIKEKSPAVAFISSSFDRSGRVELLRGLMQHMPVDSFGKICRNRFLAEDDGFDAKRRTLARYRFTLAFENAIETDYVTEKFFDPLRAGSVPVYLGAPNIEDFVPGDDCFINAADFDGPRALAQHLNALAADERAYRRYSRWRERPLRPAFRDMLARIEAPPLCRLSSLVRARHAAAPESAGGRAAC